MNLSGISSLIASRSKKAQKANIFNFELMTTMKDNFGIEISTNNAECVEWISKFNIDVIRYSKEFIGHLKKARECDASCITPRIFLASL